MNQITRRLVLLISLILSLTLIHCGGCKQEAPKTDETKAEESKTEGSKTDNASAPNEKVAAYEKFVNSFCALAEKIEGASDADKLTLGAEFTTKTGELKTLTTDILSARSSLSAEDQEKVDQLDKKAEDCAKKGAAASGSNVKTPSTNDLKNKLPTNKVPGL